MLLVSVETDDGKALQENRWGSWPGNSRQAGMKLNVHTPPTILEAGSKTHDDNKALRKHRLKIKAVSRDDSQCAAWEKPKRLSRKGQAQQTMLRNSKKGDVPTPASVCLLAADLLFSR